MPITISKSKTRAATQSGGVEIAGFPQLLLTREFGAPDALFIPLVEAAREAMQVSKLFASQGGKDFTKMAAMHIATSFLQDASFTFASKNSQTQSQYYLDLAAETIHARTWLFATGGKRTSSFLVSISGNFQNGPFTARTVAEEKVIAEFDEQRLRQPEFFTSILPDECLRFQMGVDHLKRFGALPAGHEPSGVRVTLSSDSEPIPILLRKVDSTNSYEIVDERTPCAWVCFRMRPLCI